MEGGRYSFSYAVRLIDWLSVRLFGERLFDFYGRDSLTEDDVVLTGHLVHLTDTLLSLKRVLLADANSIFSRDPAATGIDEVIYCYPGFYAIFCHRAAHILYEADIPLLPRFISEYAHSLTGIDIHPGARIGEGFSIDHGTGIVIGETAEIGESVAIYHGVTVGAKNLSVQGDIRPSKKEKRHPTVEKGCVICADAQILGKDTVIGANSVIGAGVRVTSSVPPGTVVYYNKGFTKEE